MLLRRDIKPANILMNLEGEPKITDFGISAFINSTLAVVGARAMGCSVSLTLSSKQAVLVAFAHLVLGHG